MFEFLEKLFRSLKPRSQNNSNSYLIEFRFYGKAKKYSKDLCRTISNKFHVSQVAKAGRPPHITLYGGFTTSDEKDLIRRFVSVCKSFDNVTFKLNGFSHIREDVIHLDIEPSKELEALRWSLAKELNPFCECQSWDKEEKNFIFHSTLAFKYPEGKFTPIWKYLKHIEKPNFNQYLLRVTLLRNYKILKEYDLLQRRLLNRDEALSRESIKKTIELVKEIKQNGRKRKTFVISEKEEPDRNIFFISDLHLDHENIIKYTKRPFKNVTEMNRILVDNWNKTVRPKDTVYFLGDMSYGRHSRKASYWLKQLNGRIVFIEGNHEEVGNVKSYSSAYNVILKYNGYEFALTHDPAVRPEGWTGWVIHGHKHNNDLKEFPLINKDKKTINVSCELLDYLPIELGDLISMVSK